MASQQPGDWVDGFLFVGNLPVLDFLNTRPVVDGTPTELLPNPAALERWLIASGIITSPKARTIIRRWRDKPAAEIFLKNLLAFRERLRTAVTRLQQGLPVSDAFIAEINRLLANHPSRIVLRKRAAELESTVVFDPQEPEDLWAPIAAATAELFSQIPPSRIRKCESRSCILHFYDNSKKGSRRWCSMNICGNRLKVAAYQRRKRGTRS